MGDRAQGTPIKKASLKAKGFQQITDLSSASGLTVPNETELAVFSIEGASVRYRDDGTSPTSSVGMLLHSGTVFEYNGPLNAIEFIEVASGAKLNVSYYG